MARIKEDQMYDEKKIEERMIMFKMLRGEILLKPDFCIEKYIG